MRCEATCIMKQEAGEAMLKRFDAYIVKQVHLLSRSFLMVVHPAAFDLEIDDLIQRVRINLWRTMGRNEISHPYAYIKRMIHNEMVNISRQQKRLVSLPKDEEWRYAESWREGETCMPDPAEEVEQRMENLARLNEIIQAILKLPPRQREAMICLLQERVDDREQLIHAFKAHQVDIEAVHWPVEKKERHLMQASLTHARRALSKSLKKQFDTHCY